MMIWRSGTIIVTPRKSDFRFSGSSWRPAYPGFIVMNMPTSLSSLMTWPSLNWKVARSWRMASSTEATCAAATESTSRSMRLNSSKHPQQPDCASPLYSPAVMR